MSDFDLQGLVQVGISIDRPAHLRIVNGAVEEIFNLRAKLRQSQSEVERLRGRCGDEFLRGACVTLAMFDPKSTEYREAVAHHGGYEALYAVAEEYDREHLFVAARWHEGITYAKELHVKVYEAEREAQRLRQQAAESENV